MKKAISLLFLFSSVAMYSLNTNKKTTLPPALAVSYTYTNPTCPGLNNGTINGTVSGGSLPYSNFSLSNGTTVLTSSSGLFTNLAPGTYTLSISDAITTATQSGIILIAPSDLSISSPVTICSGMATTLSVSGSTTGFLWTATPPDASLTSANNTSASPVVRPNQNTTYTVTSSVNSPSANMVTNGNFSQGNLGFTSDYIYIPNAGTSGVQRAYGVVTTANSWFQFFPSCNIEHTSGTGKMMVIDGSTINAGADKVWGQTITVQPNQTYTFSYWIQTVALPNEANIEVKINGVVVGTDLAPSTECSWSLRTYTWNSGTATSAQIAIYDKVVVSSGNDFALDDISFTTNIVCGLSKSVVITVTPFPEFTITKGCDGSNYVLSATGIGTLNANYIWYNNLHQNIGTTPSITIANEGNYSLQLSNNGCSEEKFIAANTIKCSIPKGISPNGDGNNDIFDLSNLNVNRLQIFNRYGIEVYSKSNYTNEWTGKSNSGDELPDGTYYFIVQYTNGKNKTGWVYINK